MDNKDIKVYLIGRDLKEGKELVTVQIPTDEEGVFEDAIVLLATPEDAIHFLNKLPEGNGDKIYETTIENILADSDSRGLKYVLIAPQEEEKVPTLLV